MRASTALTNSFPGIESLLTTILVKSPFNQTVNTIVLIVISYALGYSLQEAFTVLGMITTSYKKANKFDKWLINRFCKSLHIDSINLPEINRSIMLEIYRSIDATENTKTLSRINRTIDLLQIGTALVPGCFLTTVILFIGKFTSKIDSFIPAILFLILWLLFLNVANIKTIQLSIFYTDLETFKNGSSATPDK